MRIGGSGTIEANINPSANGALRGDDRSSELDFCKVLDIPLIIGVAVEFSQAQCLNAVASGLQVLIDWVSVDLETANQVSFRKHNTALANDDGVSKAINPSGVAGITHGYWETNVSLLGTELWSWRNVGSSGIVVFPFKRPIILEEGEGLIIACANASTTCRFGFGIREV